MRCLTEPQIEEFARRPEAELPTAWVRHVSDCDKCRTAIEQAREDAALIADLRELSATRGMQTQLEQAIQETLSRA